MQTLIYYAINYKSILISTAVYRSIVIVLLHLLDFSSLEKEVVILF